MSSVAEKLDPSKKREKPPLTPEEKKRRQRKGLIKGVIILTIAILGVWGFYEGMKAASGTQYPVVVVVSGSMEPTIHVGDLLFVHRVAPMDIKNGTVEDKTGDVILYDSNGLWSDPQPDPIVHRVVGKRFDTATNMWYFKTKGDYNPDIDPPDCTGLPCPEDTIIEVPEDHILGIIWGDIPYIGSMKVWLADPTISITLMIIIGAALVISIMLDTVHPVDEEEKESKKVRKRNVSLEFPKDVVPTSSDLGYVEVITNNKGEDPRFVGKGNDIVKTSPEIVQVNVEKVGTSLASITKDEGEQLSNEAGTAPLKLDPTPEPQSLSVALKIEESTTPLSPTSKSIHASTGLGAEEPAVKLPHPLIADPSTNAEEDPAAMLSIEDAGKRWVCPHCGNNDRRMIRELIDKTALLYPYPPFYGKKLNCGNCGKEWRHK